MQLSPYFYNLVPLLFTPEPWNFNPDQLQNQSKNYSSLNEIRKANLAKLASKVLKPANFSLKSGIIVTDSASKKEKI